MSSERHVALLRGINVGKAKRISMAELKLVYESLGLTEVRTLLNSGNVAFTAPGKVTKNLAAELEQATTQQLGVSSRVTLVPAAELRAIVDENPLLDVSTNPSRLLITLLRDGSDRPKLEAIAREDWLPDVFALGSGATARVAYLWCSESLLASKLAETLHKKLGDGATSRNWATILKLDALAQALTADRDTSRR